MAIIPPYEPPTDPNEDQKRVIPVDAEFRYVSKSEAQPEDRVTMADRLTILAAIATAQLVRLAIIFGAVGIIILVIFLASHIPK